MGFTEYLDVEDRLWKKLFADIVGGGTPSTANPENYSLNRGLSWLNHLRIYRVVKGYLFSRGDTVTLSEKGLKGSGARLVPEGTVLFTSSSYRLLCRRGQRDINKPRFF